MYFLPYFFVNTETRTEDHKHTHFLIQIFFFVVVFAFLDSKEIWLWSFSPLFDDEVLQSSEKNNQVPITLYKLWLVTDMDIVTMLDLFTLSKTTSLYQLVYEDLSD